MYQVWSTFIEGCRSQCSQGCYGRTDGWKEGRKDGRQHYYIPSQLVGEGITSDRYNNNSLALVHKYRMECRLLFLVETGYSWLVQISTGFRPEVQQNFEYCSVKKNLHYIITQTQKYHHVSIVTDCMDVNQTTISQIIMPCDDLSKGLKWSHD